MPTRLLVAPAASGKTQFALDCALRAAQNLRATPRVIVPTRVQVRAWKKRIARSGGGIGVRVMPFDALYAELLNAAGETYITLSDPVQFRLLRALVDRAPLAHYQPLQNRSGFILSLQQLIGELKAARIFPEDFERALAMWGSEPRLVELARIYAAYQDQLRDENWADEAGLAWLAVIALEQRAAIARDWQLVIVDGFDHFTQVQIELLRTLGARVGEMLVTLTGGAPGAMRERVHDRFNQTRARLEKTLGVTAEPLPTQHPPASPVLAHLEAHLYQPNATRLAAATTVELIEAVDRAGEVRAALRWLKQRVVTDGASPGDLALIARDLAPYRPFILQIAAELGLPLRVLDGLPLRASPVVVALLDLLRMMLPNENAEPSLPLRLVVQAWRSPYFDWNTNTPLGILPGDAEQLDRAARFGRVIGGRAQWDEALALLTQRAADAPDDDDREMRLPGAVPQGDAARILREKFLRFVARVTPPADATSYRAFAGWLEKLIGADPAQTGAPDDPESLRIVERARDPGSRVAAADIAALEALKNVLRGLVWAEQAVAAAAPVDFAAFFADLVGAINVATFRLRLDPAREEITAARVFQARGAPFRAVAILGLAEGEFPATLAEDPFLRDADRARLINLGFNLDLPTASAETEFFYEAITRPWERLLLTRPRLADNGAAWQASPFWEEVCARLAVTPRADPLAPANVASWSELLEAAHPAAPVWAAALQAAPAKMRARETATELFCVRARAQASAFNGDLTELGDEFARRFAVAHVWSASRLETYRDCPYRFFVESVLHLEPRVEPAEGLDARQLGTVYHRIFEALFKTVPMEQRADLAALLAALPGVARPILDDAPAREGFRATAWWEQTRAEILDHVKRSLEALATLGDYTPLAFEAKFDGVRVAADADAFRLRGVIDRVDRDAQGNVRVLDYKTSSPYAFTTAAVFAGKKLQLPLYALAARDALNLGAPREGFYLHVRHAVPSQFSLANFPGGADAAIQTAIRYAFEAVRGARAGKFAPQPPAAGCPNYCAATKFCWAYTPGLGG